MATFFNKLDPHWRIWTQCPTCQTVLHSCCPPHLTERLEKHTKKEH